MWYGKINNMVKAILWMDKFAFATLEKIRTGGFGADSEKCNFIRKLTDVVLVRNDQEKSFGPKWQ